jgi:hypothetical protein
MKTRIFILTALLVLVAGCAELNSILQSVEVDAPLTESEVAGALKEALTNGSEIAARGLSLTDGYFLDESVKILFPEEANVILENLSRIPGGDKLVEDIIRNINRAAEDAAREVAPIFAGSIRSMTIRDAFGILNGEDNAATLYLQRTTGQELYDLYKPKIRASTSRAIIGGVSARDSWEELTKQWNTLANSVVGRMAGFEPVNVDLDDYLTRRALDGMYLKVAAEELKIRTEVSARITPLMKKVFGTLDS